MQGPSMLKGTWLVLVMATMPLLASQIANAASNYPVTNPPAVAHAVTYDSSDRLLTVETMTSEGTATTTGTSTPGITEGPEPATTDSDTVTEVSGTVTGPNGQVNHGQVIKKLHELTEENSGCLNSAVAQSDMGKGGEDADPISIEVDCTKTNPSEDRPSTDEETDSPSSSAESSGKPDKTDSPPGKSEKAPGKNE